MTRVPWKHKRQESAASDSRPLNELRNEVDRLFDSCVREPLERAGRSIASRSAWSPLLDMAETEQAVTVWAEVPGIDVERLDITVTGDTLVVSGDKPDPREDEASEVRFSERGYGSFRRSVQLPSAVDADRVTAECRGGVLTVRLPKVTKAPPSKITVQPS